MRVKLLRLQWLVGAWVLASLFSCSKKLSKEEAKTLVESHHPAKAIVCTLEAPYDAKVVAKTLLHIKYTNRNKDWIEFANTLGFVSNMKCSGEDLLGPFQPSVENCQTNFWADVTPYFTCKNSHQDFGGPTGTDCDLAVPCGEYSVAIDSVISEDRSALVKYTMQPNLEPKYKAVSESDAEAYGLTNDEKSLSYTMKFMTDDSGHWVKP